MDLEYLKKIIAYNEVLLGDKKHSLPDDAERCRIYKYGDLKLNGKTQVNLNKLTELYDMIWEYIVTYQIRQDIKVTEHGMFYSPNWTYKYASGYIIYGTYGIHNITYFRKETSSKGAGGTELYFDDGKSLQVSTLLTNDWPDHRYLSKKRVNDFKNFLKFHGDKIPLNIQKIAFHLI